ncbi:hypothetical protein [Hymenobacter guriensis]|uniref:Uncharacterized protein n=1 Tax=Hymenobacter guriensis TaxID=2793065 RepID=A0ABS0KX11_9BACT|nr:hypothetical protein [Hymenobacter guriensis]MBG8552397.1 hypothetical protein [Hymenobacter guriensis]
MSDSAPRLPADEEWEDLLRQWREQPAPQPRPYFYSRVRARLISKTSEHRPQRTWVRWPAYAVMLGIVLLLSGDGAALPSAERNATPEAPLHGR